VGKTDKKRIFKPVCIMYMETMKGIVWATLTCLLRQEVDVNTTNWLKSGVLALCVVQN